MPDEPPVKTPAATAARRGLNSVTNAFSVLEYLVEAGEAGVSEIARRVGVTVGTAHRLVATLVEIGWAEQNPDNRRYRPSQRLVAMAHSMRKTLNARELAHEQLTSLVQAVHETGNLAIFSDRRALRGQGDLRPAVRPRSQDRLEAPRVLHCARQGARRVDDAALDDYLALLETVRRGKQPPTPPPVAAFRRSCAALAIGGTRWTRASTFPMCTAPPPRARDGRSRRRRHERVGAAIAIRDEQRSSRPGGMRRGGRALGHAAGSRPRRAVDGLAVLGLG